MSYQGQSTHRVLSGVTPDAPAVCQMLCFSIRAEKKLDSVVWNKDKSLTQSPVQDSCVRREESANKTVRFAAEYQDGARLASPNMRCSSKALTSTLGEGEPF